MSLSEKHRQIKEWLEGIYIDEEIPAYEINATTIDHLYNLMTVNKTRDRDTRLGTEDMRQKAEEYRAEATRLSKIVKAVGLDARSLSQSGVSSLRTLIRLAEILQLKRTTESCYLLAMRRLHKDLVGVAEERKVIQRATGRMFEKKTEFLLQSAKWKTALENFDEERRLQAPEILSHKQGASFFLSKAKEYRKQQRKYIECLRRVNLDPSEYHGALVTQAEALEDLKEKLQPLNEKLNSYHSLPPDITMAKVKIEELKQQMEFTEREMNQRINVIHM